MRALLLVVVIACGGPAAPVIANQTATVAPVAVPDVRFAMKVVVSDSDFMKRVATEVGAGVGDIHAYVDGWHDPASGGIRDDYLVAPDREALDRYFQALAKRGFRLPEDRELAYQQLPDGSWRSFYLERDAAIRGAMIEKVRRSYDDSTGRPAVLLDLTEAGGRVLAELTKRITGRKLAILVGGTIRSVPVVTAPILEGRVIIVMSGTNASELEREADALVDVFKQR
jgi:hypothetical protein